MKVIAIPTHYVHRVWANIYPYIYSGLCEGKEQMHPNSLYTLDQVQSYVVSGEWELFISLDEEGKIHGAMTVAYINYPLHRVAFITIVGGRNICTKSNIDQLKTLFLERGVTLIQAYGRRSISRLWGRIDFKPRAILMELTI